MNYKDMDRMAPIGLKNSFRMEEANTFIRNRIDLEDAPENPLDGHGYEVSTGLTVYMIDGFATVFCLDNNDSFVGNWRYNTRVLTHDEYVLYKDLPVLRSSMNEF